MLSAKRAARDSPSSENIFVVFSPSKLDLTFDRSVGDTDMMHLSSLQAIQTGRRYSANRFASLRTVVTVLISPFFMSENDVPNSKRK